MSSLPRTGCYSHEQPPTHRLLHPLCGALLVLCRMCQSGLHVELRSHIGILMRLLAVEPRSTGGFLFPCISVSLLNDLGNPVFDGVILAGFEGRANAYWPKLLTLFFCLLLFTLSLLSFYGLVLWDRGLQSIALSRPCISNFFNNTNKK